MHIITMFNLFDLQPGDDIQYRSSNSSDSSVYCGRISNVGGVDGSVYFVIHFDVYTDPSPPPTFMCLPLEELCLTSETELRSE